MRQLEKALEVGMLTDLGSGDVQDLGFAPGLPFRRGIYKHKLASFYWICSRYVLITNTGV